MAGCLRALPDVSDAKQGKDMGETRGRAVEPTPVEWFVDQMAIDLGLGTRSVDERCRRILYRLSRWAAKEGLALDREVILDPATVERFCQIELAHDRSRATFRSDLRRMGPQLTRRAPWEPRPAAMAVRMVAMPYSPAEVALLKSDARNQSTPHRRRGARVLLALGLGAGLDGRWVAEVCGDHVMARDGCVEVKVGEPAARSVIVRATWEAEVLKLADLAGHERLLETRSRTTNRVTNFTKRLTSPTGHPRLSPPRLRSTWLLDHLNAGTRLDELCRAAGLAGFTVLPDLMAFMTRLEPSNGERMLRGRR
jgi:hypothetical protein